MSVVDVGKDSETGVPEGLSKVSTRAAQCSKLSACVCNRLARSRLVFVDISKRCCKSWSVCRSNSFRLGV